MTIPRNKSLSGGPSSSRGIALASQNSLKTGVYSTQVLFPGDDADEFEALLDNLLADFRPRNSLEQALVQDVAALLWKKQRIESIEQRTLRESFQKLVDALPLDFIFEDEEYPVELPVYLWDGLKLTTKQVAAYRETIPQIEKFIDKRSQARHTYEVPPDSLLFAELDGKAMEIGLTGAELLAQGRTKSFPLYDKLSDILEQLLGRAQSYLCIASKKKHLTEVLMLGWTPLMGTEFHNDKLRRAIEDNSRALYRTLAELRKLQSWRLYVDVQDVERSKVIESDQTGKV